VKTLLDRDDVDPNAEKPTPFRLAYYGGHEDVI
jgi:hypothetical protein